jgi:ankyrin repeat protein
VGPGYEERISQIEAEDGSEGTGLHLAAQLGQYNVAKLLLEIGAVRGAVRDAVDENGQTPLHRAASNGHDEVVELLLEENEEGVDTLRSIAPWQMGKSAPRNYWRSSRRSQKKFSTGSLTSKLLNLNALVGQQASGGCKEAISMLINLGTNMDTPVGFIADHYCWTLLHIAVRWKHPGVPHLLLEMGANRYARDSDGKFPKTVAEKLNDSQLKACFAVTKSCILED